MPAVSLHYKVLYLYCSSSRVYWMFFFSAPTSVPITPLMKGHSCSTGPVRVNSVHTNAFGLRSVGMQARPFASVRIYARVSFT